MELRDQVASKLTDDDDLTLVTASFNTPDVTTTMLRSFVHHHGEGPHSLLIMENSTDGKTRSFLERDGVPYVSNTGGTHSPSVDRALGLCRTRFALLVDTDVVFHRSIRPALEVFRSLDLTLMGEVCGDRGGYILHPRAHPWFCFIDVDRIRAHGIHFHDEERIRQTGSDGFFGNIPINEARASHRLYDVGSTFYEDIDQAGLRIGHARLEPHFFTHYEGMSWHRETGLDAYTTLGDKAAAVFQFDHAHYRGADLSGCFRPGFDPKDVAPWPTTVPSESASSGGGS